MKHIISRIIPLLLTLIFLLPACKKADIPKDTPRAIKKIIRQIERGKVTCYSEIYEYEYNGDILYLLYNHNHCTDIGHSLVNEKGEHLCSFGSMFNVPTDYCNDFYKNGVKKRLIYSKDK